MESTFWTEHRRDLHDPDYLRAYVISAERTATVDRIINQLEAARIRTGISKTALARALSMGDASVRRLFSLGRSANPTMHTLVDIAAALGYRVTLEEMDEPERHELQKTVLTAH